MAKTKLNLCARTAVTPRPNGWGAAPNAARGTAWQKNWKRRLPVRSKVFLMPKEAPKPKTLDKVMLTEVERLKTGINEFDRVLGGGLVPGSLVLFGRRPGHRQINHAFGCRYPLQRRGH